MYLIWRGEATAKGAKKITPPNVVRLQYFVVCCITMEDNSYTLLNVCGDVNT